MMTRRRVLAGLVLLTLAALVLDQADAPPLGAVRTAAATVLGPLERLAGGQGESLTEVSADRDRLVAAAAADLTARRAERQLAELVGAPSLRDIPMVPARVVAVGRSGGSGIERLTIDVGSRDGVEVDQTVVAADGLVGRTVSVAPWTSDVVVVGAPGLRIGVRVGSRGVLGSVGPAPSTGTRPRDRGLLDLALVQRGVLEVGANVSTLGSVQGRPFLPGIPVGTVRAVDPEAAALTSTGAVQPAVDPAELDVVAVLQPRARDTARRVIVPTSGTS